MRRGKTYMSSEKELLRKWYIIDAKDKTLGRLATVAAGTLRGKEKGIFSPHIDCGDFLIIINAKDVVVTGKKEGEKTYFSHSGYAGGHRLTVLAKLRETYPERIIYHAIAGMLPKNKLSDQIIKKLKVYAGGEHPHAAQKPEQIKL